MSDELRSLNGLTPSVGRSDGLRPAKSIDPDMSDGGHSPEYQPNDWRDGREPATTRIRRREGGGGASADDIPSPLQAELDRLRSVGETATVDTKSLRGKKYYSGDSSAYHRAAAADSGPDLPPAKVYEEEAETPTGTDRIDLPSDSDQ
ncbi:MAG: hypothetical protein EA402_01840 [Planctomycetota bacterium]|nr:MAG: hypothetical protein EA402_01840 [Planctomycetota bacterium]